MITVRSMFIRGTLLTFVVAPSLAGSLSDGQQPATAEQVQTIRVPGTTVSFDLARCEGDDTTPTLWVLTTEVPWELYDVYVYALDVPEGNASDAIARPSKPYVPPDRGFGHEGYPAMGMTRAAAEGFCDWLSAKAGIAFRLPTPDEWTSLTLDHDEPGEQAWTRDNAEFTTHPVGELEPNAHGLHDMLGNVAEWVMTDTRKPIAMGGSYRDAPADCRPDATQQQQRAWNASDPQIPKSKWWLADCSWVGFRFVTDEDPAAINQDQNETTDE